MDTTLKTVPNAEQLPSDLDAVKEVASARDRIAREIEKRIVGQHQVVDHLLTALFARGHCLFVGVPGLAKTLLISTLAETQFQAFQITFMSFLPQLLLSGFMFPFEGMPKAAQYLAEVFPLTHFLRIVRGIILRDASLSALTAEIWPLALFFVIVILLATSRFQKRLD